MQHSTCSVFWEPVRDSLLPLAVVLLNAIVLWVVHRLRSISEDVQQTSRVSEASFVTLHQSLGRSGSPLDVLDQRKSSTKGITYTSPGDDESPA